MRPRIVTRTSSKGMISGPKDAARPMIQNRMAAVKIVQNTALLLKRVVTFPEKIAIQQFGLEFVARPEGALQSRVESIVLLKKHS
jgi:hypothetical protein